MSRPCMTHDLLGCLFCVNIFVGDDTNDRLLYDVLEQKTERSDLLLAEIGRMRDWAQAIMNALPSDRLV